MKAIVCRRLLKILLHHNILFFGILFLISASHAAAADSVDVTFRYYNTGVPTPYLVGEFNSWNNAAWPMGYIGIGWVRTARLAVGGNPSPGIPGAWQYKFYYSGASPWPNDPLNHHVNHNDNDNSFLYVKNPTIYQFLPNQRNPIVTTATPVISAYIYPKVGDSIITSSLSLNIDGTVYAGIGSSYNVLTQQLSFPSPQLANGPHTVILQAGTNADTVNFTVQAGYIKILNQFPVSTWESSWKINGRVESDVVAMIKLVRNAVDTFQVPVSARTFSYVLPLVNGTDSIKAIADSSGQTVISGPIVVTRLVNHVPAGRISFSNDLYTVTLHADSSTNADGILTGLMSYQWSVDSTNPSPIGGVDGSSNPQITISKPPTAGEYYFNLIVTDTNGYRDTTRNYFILDDSGNVSYPTITSNPGWLNQGRMYQMFFKSATAAGTINAALPHLGYLKNMGYNIVWVMPVMKNAFPMNNMYGTGYDIVDFYNVAPEYGTNADLKNFVRQAHALGLKVILDITPNHTSKYHPFVDNIKSYRQNSIYWNYYQHALITNPNYHPDLSEALTSDSLIVYYYAFSDELLNYNWSDLDARTYMINVYKYWIREFGVDGYRFDVYWGPHDRANAGNGGENEMGLPVRTALKHIKPDILLLGEASGTGVGTELLYADRNGGVDAAYDWNLLHNGAQAFYSGGPQINALNNTLLNCGGCSMMGFLPGPNSYFMRCLENQDEDRIISTYGSELNIPNNPVTSAHATIPVSSMIELSVGLPLVYSGQEVGWGFGISGQKENRSRSVIDWNDSLRYILQPHYQKLAQIRKQFSAFWSRQQIRITGSNGNVLGYSRPKNDINGLIFSNFTNSTQTSFVGLSAGNVSFSGGIQNGKTYYACDLYNDSVYQVIFSGGNATLPITLSPYGTSVIILADTIYTLALPVITDVKEHTSPFPKSYALFQNYPNPFNPATTISFNLLKNEHVSLRVYNLLGEEVSTLVNTSLRAGSHNVVWNAGNLPSGVYFYKLTTTTFTAIKKMVLLR